MNSGIFKCIITIVVLILINILVGVVDLYCMDVNDYSFQVVAVNIVLFIWVSWIDFSLCVEIVDNYKRKQV